MATTWTITRRQGVCAATGRDFNDGERHVSQLVIHEGTLHRVDLSLDAWNAIRAGDDVPAPADSPPQKPGASDGDEEAIVIVPTAEPLFWWRTRHEAQKKKTVQLDMESLGELFVQLEGREELQVRELRYVLCLLLMRKRRVKVEKVLREGDEEAFIVKRPKVDERYKVYVYDFEPERLEQVRAQLQAIFDGAEGPHGIRLGDEDGEESPAEAGEPDADDAGDADGEADQGDVPDPQDAEA